MKVYIRVDASTQIGTGHIIRCLALADELCKRGIITSFISRKLPGNLCDLVKKKGFKVHILPYIESSVIDWEIDLEQTRAVLAKEIDWLILDSYTIDFKWEIQMRPYVKRIMVIDDLADRQHDCDLLLDQNLYENFESRYDGLIPHHCQKFLGPKYALLRPEFKEARKNLKHRNGFIKRILISFGGSDQSNETAKALEAVKLLNMPDIAVDVIVGKANPYAKMIKQLCSVIPNTTFYCQIDNMAQLMADADLAVGAGGTSTWERCCLGLPAILIVLADNQKEIAEWLDKEGMVLNLGWYEDITEKGIKYAINELLNDKKRLKQMSVKAKKIIDGRGVERIVTEIEKRCSA
jgi:UDP-2,4-diacetamido-2,4,6-trideoxy-beta-L-altropyranose hydrolase